MSGLTHPYSSEAYARAFEGLAEPLALPALGTWILKRRIPGTDRHDAAGCYPLSVLQLPEYRSPDFSRLQEHRLVSLVLVADAFFGPEPEVLRRGFDVVRPFKSHHVHDYSQAFDYGRHHRYEVKRARGACETRPVTLAAHLKEWTGLYEELCVRHRISGLQRFSMLYFERLAALPALHTLSAWHAGELAGMHLFIEHEGVAYSHLAAFSEAGYRARAGYAVNDYAIEHFRGLRLIDFGAGAGIDDDPADGLAAFKRGFANRSEIFYLCGKVLDDEAYELLSGDKRRDAYFPAYRGR